MPESQEMTEQTDWRAKLQSQEACVAEDLKCRGAWDTTCGQYGKDVTPSIASRIVERGSAWQSSSKWRERPSSIRRTLELFQRQRRGSFWETGGSHMGFSERIDTILNWTWMWWFYSKQHVSSITIHPSLTLRFQSQICRHIKYGSFAYWLLSYHKNKTDSINS